RSTSTQIRHRTSEPIFSTFFAKSTKREDTSFYIWSLSSGSEFTDQQMYHFN
ncbi:2492_t:CDS:1, partial [Funneliformis caledonium]